MVNILDGEVQHPVAEEIHPLHGERRSRFDPDLTGPVQLPGRFSRQQLRFVVAQHDAAAVLVKSTVGDRVPHGRIVINC